MAVKRQHSPPPGSSELYFSSPIYEQTSTFTAAFSPSLSPKALQALPEFRSATHRITAWRKPSRQKSLKPGTHTLYDTGHDDDGEKWAGTRLSKVLNDTNSSGAVVVARWYGGHNIGPIRFRHIEASARAAIHNAQVASSSLSSSSSSSRAQPDNHSSAKKQKIDAEAQEAQRKELVAALQERDYNITALRKLLSEKKARLLGEPGEEVKTPQKGVEYEGMSLDALLRLDKARDATVAFVLKQIDKVDEEMKLVEALEGEGTEEANQEAERKEDAMKTAPATPE
ncbi:hypothetical protein yc1106_02648 [Curvularia clavata]|uniref:Impact N-terminal domain-containing protein n=1 Tax=Curvularia clavata TaxID=95742 RepID=A0A9Q8Z3L9_CURCL|nr:hypothetical protein yc1106_02648 [Curvularia clavata]